jgi:hypothetical protein
LCRSKTVYTTLGYIRNKDGHHIILNLLRKSWTYSFIVIVNGEYKTWIIYLVMEHSIEFSMQKGKEWAYKNKYHILENPCTFKKK